MPAAKDDVVVISSSEDEDSKPTASKAKPKVAAKPAVKRKSRVVDTESEAEAEQTAEESAEEEEKSAKKKKVSVAKVGAKVTAKAPVKKPPVKRAKKEDAGPKKEEWQFVPDTTGNGEMEEADGQENCLAGLTFVFTGELRTLSREEGTDLVKRYGGRVTGAPSSKTSYVVVGADAGPVKMAKIKEKGIKTLSQEEFLQLINRRPSGAADEKFIAKKEAEQKTIVAEAKKMVLTKDAPEHKTELWTSKYAPEHAPDPLKAICGNTEPIRKLSAWLTNWSDSARCNFKKPGKDLMGGYRAVLISGAPGIGKTTAAHVVAQLAGYKVLELNASDARSKKLLESAFSSTVNNTTLDGFYKGDKGTADGTGCPIITKKTLIIMDEVDGMSSGDRGGVGALNALIKKTKVPIIAICNDKSNPKMKPFIATCFYLAFRRPSADQIRSRMMTIAFKEGIKVDTKAIDQLVAGAQSDIRQIINMLSTWKLTKKVLDFDAGKAFAKSNEKNQIQTVWTLYPKLFGPQAFSPVSGMTLDNKMELYFHDFSFLPLFVQENYLKSNFSRTSSCDGQEKVLKDLELAAAAAESMSDADLVDQMIHGGQQWSLMPVHAVFSCVIPASHCYGSGVRPNLPPSKSGGEAGWGSSVTFPTWFGANSSQGKMQRLLGEIQIRMRLRVSGDRKEIRQSYIPTLFAKIVTPLQVSGLDAIDQVIQIMDDYFLTKEQWDAIVDLGVGADYRAVTILAKIPTATKSAFTRNYNKISHPIPFCTPDDGKMKKLAAGPAPDQEDVLLDDVDDDEMDGEDADGEVDAKDGGLGKDKMIKLKPIKAPRKAAVKKVKSE